MLEKINLLLLIHCVILCQGIIATLSDDDIRESSDLLVREKRVINLDQQGHGSASIEDIGYMVTITENGRTNCMGVILSSHTVITAATCVANNLELYQILSNSAFAQYATIHSISSKVTHSGNPPHKYFDGIALVNVDPPFTFGQKTKNIFLYTGPIRAGIEATISGWGSSYPLLVRRKYHKRLRTIKVPIISHSQCENYYRDHFSISYKYICTYHERQFCARSDQGAPLVIDNKLAGIHVLKTELENHPNPDMFINLQLPEYSVWIRQNIRFG